MAKARYTKHIGVLARAPWKVREGAQCERLGMLAPLERLLAED